MVQQETAWRLAAVVLIAASGSLGLAQTPAERTLVVYNAAHADSAGVANYYMTRRGIPAPNLCAINSASTTTITQPQFESDLKVPVRDCISRVGKARILYIVLAYPVPYKLTVANGGTYSVDQALADIWDEDSAVFATPYPARPHGYYADVQSQGNVYPAFVPFATYRGGAGVPAIYSVWRLDGPTAAIARGLVDKAIQAELNGLTGTACLDRRLGDVTVQRDTTGDGGAEWDLTRAARISGEAGFPVIEDANSQEFGTSPAPLRCDNAALYAGWYSLNNYPDAFTWNPGAIGFHLDGNSAVDPRGGTNFAANALLRGITITSGALVSPSLFGFVHPDGIFRNLFEGANAGDAVLRNSPWLKWVVLNIGDPLYRPFPAGRPPFHTPRLEDRLDLNPRSLVGGNGSSGTVDLATPAPAGGATVMLYTGSSTVATVAASITVPAGATRASFPITTRTRTTETSTTIRAEYGGVTRTNTLVVSPLLSSLVINKTSVTGGTEATGTVLLTYAAPAGGVSVALSTSNAAVVAPSTVFVPAGMDRANFTITTSPVAAKVSASVAAAHSGRTVTDSLGVNPPAPTALTLSPTSVAGGSQATGTVTLTGPAPGGSYAVALSSSNAGATVPASVNVAAGASSVSFDVSTAGVSADTTASISAAAGGVTKSATLTIRAATGALTASVSPTSRVGGSNVSMKVTLATAAPQGGTQVTLSSNNPAATVPPSVTVPAGALSAYATVTTKPVAASTAVTLSAATGGAVRNVTLTVLPAALSSVTATRTSLAGGTSTTGRVRLNGAAAAGGVVVNLSSSSAVATVPSSVTVAAGSTSSPVFTISTTAVTSQTGVVISAVHAGVTKTVAMTVNPPNALPAATLTAPSAGSSYLAPATVNLSATASDSDGSIVSVDFLNGSTVICTDTTSPYACSWTAPGGTHSLTARATDNLGGTGTSSAVSVIVRGVRIMPLGDSITHGADIPGGYRIGLWSRLVSAGDHIDFVGSEVNGPPTLVDQNHQGHRGWRIDQIQASIGGWLATQKPQVVLVHLGTNDIVQAYQLSTAPSRLSALIDQITAAAPQAYVIVAAITPMQDTTRNSRAVTFNSAIPGIVDSKIAAGKRVRFVDMYNAVTLADLYDGIHPNAGGYDKMAALWNQALTSIMPLLTPQ